MADTYNGQVNYSNLSDKERFTQFLRSRPGVLLAISFALNLLTLIFLIAVYGALGSWGFLLTVVIIIFVYQILLALTFTKGWNNTITEINWPLTIMINTAIASLMLFIANIAFITSGWMFVTYNLARFTSLGNCFLLGYKAFIEFEDWRARREQGQTQVVV